MFARASARNAGRVGMPLERAASTWATTIPPLVGEVVGTSGAALDPDTRAVMEAGFGADFSGVRVHADGRAAESARSMGAQAYTVGHSIAFDQGRYEPGSSAGRQLLAHELAHVVQQSRGGDAGAPDARTESDAVHAAESALAGQRPSLPVATRRRVQRQASQADLEWARRLETTFGFSPYELASRMGYQGPISMEWFAKELQQRGILDAAFKLVPRFAAHSSGAPLVGERESTEPSIGPLSESEYERGKEYTRQRQEAEYHEQHPTLRDVVVADSQRLSKAADPSGSGIVKAGAQGAYLLAGQSLNEAQANANRVESVAQIGAFAVSLPELRGSQSSAVVGEHASTQATRAEARADAFLQRFPKVDRSPESTAALAELFNRTGAGGADVTPRPGKYVPQLSRSAAPEMKTIIELSSRNDVVRIELVPSSAANRTPDLIAHIRQSDGAIMPTRVEITTATGAPRGYQDRGSVESTESNVGTIVSAIRRKATSTPESPSQLDVPIAGVPAGGILVVHLPRAGPEATTEIAAAMARLGPELAGAPHVQSIEFVLQEAARVRYVRGPSGVYTRQGSP